MPLSNFLSSEIIGLKNTSISGLLLPTLIPMAKSFSFYFILVFLQLPATITFSIQNLTSAFASFKTKNTGHMLVVEESLILIPSVLMVNVNAVLFYISLPISLSSTLLYKRPSVTSL